MIARKIWLVEFSEEFNSPSTLFVVLSARGPCRERDGKYRFYILKTERENDDGETAGL